MRPDERATLERVLRRLADDGRAVLVVEHDLRLVASAADVVTVLDEGRVIASGTPDAVIADAAVRRVYLGVTRVILTRRGPRPDTSAPGEIVALAGHDTSRTAVVQAIAGLAAPARRGHARRDGDHAGSPPDRIAALGLSYVPAGRRVFPGPHRRREPRPRRLPHPPRQAASRRTARARLRPLPAPHRPPHPASRHALRRRAADAGDRPRADDRAARADPRRAVRGSRPHRDRGARRSAGDDPRRGHRDPAGRRGPAARRAASPTASCSSRTDRSCWTPSAGRLSPTRGSIRATSRGRRGQRERQRLAVVAGPQRVVGARSTARRTP